MSTAKMTLLPANDVPSPRKTLQNDMRLDDSLGQKLLCCELTGTRHMGVQPGNVRVLHTEILS